VTLGRVSGYKKSGGVNLERRAVLPERYVAGWDCLFAHGYGTFGELSLRGGAGQGGDNRERRR